MAYSMAVIMERRQQIHVNVPILLQFVSTWKCNEVKLMSSLRFKKRGLNSLGEGVVYC